MSGVGSRQKARLFIEGREVPFQSVTLTARVGAPMSATISLVPLRQIKFVRARTQVSVFVQDTKNFPDDDFYLMFEGEILGRNMSKKQDSRGFSVVALDYSSYWDEAKSYVMNPNFVLGKIEAVCTFSDAPIDETVKALAGAALTVSSTANVAIIQMMLANKNKDLAKGVVAVIKKLAGANQFYAAAFERLRINDRINLFSSQNLQKFLQDLKIEEFLTSFCGSFGGITSLRELLYSVMALVYHDFVSVPFPAYIKPSTVTASKSGPTKVKNPDSQTVSPTEANDSSARQLSSFLFIPDCYSLPPPMCNVVFPNQQQGYSFSEDFRNLPTRYAFRASMPLMTGPNTTFPQYPTRFYPTAFSDYMFKKRTAQPTELASILGPSQLLNDPKHKDKTYASIFYGNDKGKGVGTTAGLVLREADYMSNEESLKGIYLEMDTFMPSYTALVKGASPAARTAFIDGVGKYMFFKKRFAARQPVGELIFHPFLVPGFNCCFLDDSEAGQSFIAKLQSVTHVITHEGCATNVELGYGRDFDEVDELTGGSGEPPTPPWFDTSIFGTIDPAPFQTETDYLKSVGAIDAAEEQYRGLITNPTVYTNLNCFYQALLGCNAMTNFQPATQASSIAAVAASVAGTPAPPAKSKLVSMRGATSYLLSQYKSVSDDPVARDAKVLSFISRPLTPIIAAFDYLRADPAGYTKTGRFTIPDEFASFVAKTYGVSTSGNLPKRFDGTGYADENAVAMRRQIIDAYVQALRTGVGFRG